MAGRTGLESPTSGCKYPETQGSRTLKLVSRVYPNWQRPLGSRRFEMPGGHQPPGDGTVRVYHVSTGGQRTSAPFRTLWGRGLPEPLYRVPVRYRLEQFELDIADRILWRAGLPLKLQPKVLDLLIFLVRHRQRAASRVELLRAIWPDSSVGDAALRRLLKETRHALGDDGTQQRLIATVRGYGYRLAIPVEIVGQDGGDEDAYVGRESALARIESNLGSAISGQGRILLLAGEPGIGKTRFAEEAAEQGRLAGAEVLAAWASEEYGAPAYWPWLQILRELAERRDTQELRSALGGVGPELAELIPWLRERIPELAQLPSLQPDAARFRLFEALRSLFARLATRRPLVVILDDLHWADAQSLQLLDFLAHSIGSQRLLIVACYREEEMQQEPTRAQALARLSRQPAVTTQVLAGFSHDEVSRFIATRTGADPSSQVAEALHAKTAGNPLLLGEILHSVPRERLTEVLDTGAWSDAQPRGARPVIEQRLEILSEKARRVLKVASAIGRGFDGALLGRVFDGDVDDLGSALDEALRTRVVIEAPGGSYRFSHVLVRDALYDELGERERAELHRRIGNAFEAAREDGSENIHVLARQFFAAFSSGDADKAIQYSEKAGDLAARVYAFEQAARHYGHSLEILELQRDADPRHLCSLLLKLGEAHRYNGHRAGAKQTCLRAAEIARAQGWAPELARAALTMAGWAFLMAPPDHELAAVLEEAIASLGESDLALRAALLARLAAEYCLDSDVDRCKALRQQALDAAEASGSGRAVAQVLSQPYGGIWETTVPRATRLSLVEEAARRCREAGDLEGALYLDELSAEEQLARGRIDAFDTELERLIEATGRLGHPGLIATARLRQTAWAMLAGRFVEAEELAQEALELGQRLDVAGPLQAWTAQLIILRAEQGRLSELLPAIEGRAHVGDGSLTVECFKAWVYTDLGDPRARGVFERIMTEGLPTLPQYHSGLAQCAVLAHVCAGLGAAEHAPGLYDLLAPLRGGLIVRSRIACHGPVSYFLGLLAALCGRGDEARALYAETLALAARIGARPAEARTSQALARLLLAEGDASQRPRVLELVQRSLAIAGELDMRGLLAAGRLLEQEARGATPLRPAV